MSARTLRLGALVAFAWLLASRASANPEPPSADARVVGMAGVAIATVDSPAALLHNPAQLDRIERFAITASATSDSQAEQSSTTA